MLHYKPKNSVKKNMLLITAGICLQTAGSICLIASAVEISREISQQIKRAVHSELLKCTEA